MEAIIEDRLLVLVKHCQCSSNLVASGGGNDWSLCKIMKIHQCLDGSDNVGMGIAG